ncbi:MAG: heavy-metal-associated domain-containing protein [Thermodesulfobacteriota bacterium]
MSETREMKKIDLNTLDQAQKKISASKVKRAAGVLALVLALSGGAYGAYRLVSGEVVGSRFTVTKMTCPACVITIKEVTEKVQGVVGTDVSLAGQEVTVKFMSKRTSPDQIKDAIAAAGYPTRVDGVFRLDAAEQGEVVATVNGCPLFKADLTAPLHPASQAKDADEAAVFFSVAGKEILLQAANSKTVAVQPQEVAEETDAIRTSTGLSQEDFLTKMSKDYGSMEQFYKLVAQRIGIRKLFDEHVLDGVKDPRERERKTMEWLAETFKSSDVKVVSGELKALVQKEGGPIGWNTFWPRMIPKDTELKRIVMK